MTRQRRTAPYLSYALCSEDTGESVLWQWWVMWVEEVPFDIDNETVVAAGMERSKAAALKLIRAGMKLARAAGVNVDIDLEAVHAAAGVEL